MGERKDNIERLQTLWNLWNVYGILTYIKATEIKKKTKPSSPFKENRDVLNKLCVHFFPKFINI